MLALHVLVLGVTEYFDVKDRCHLGLMSCDNLGGLNKARECRRKVRSGAKHADILRCFQRIHARLHGRLDYKHVYGHQDR